MWCYFKSLLAAEEFVNFKRDTSHSVIFNTNDSCVWWRDHAVKTTFGKTNIQHKLIKKRCLTIPDRLLHHQTTQGHRPAAIGWTALSASLSLLTRAGSPTRDPSSASVVLQQWFNCYVSWYLYLWLGQIYWSADIKDLPILKQEVESVYSLFLLFSQYFVCSYRSSIRHRWGIKGDFGDVFCCTV